MIATLDDDLSAQLLLHACPPDPPFPEALLCPNVARADVYREIWAGWRKRLQNVFVPVFDTQTLQGFVFPLVVREGKPGEANVFKGFPAATEARNRVASLVGVQALFPEPAMPGVLAEGAVSGDSYGLAFLLAALWGRGCFVRAHGRDPGVTLVATGTLGEATIGPVRHVEEKLAAARARLGERLLFVYCAEQEVGDPGHDTLALPPGCPLPEALRRIFAEWSRRVGIPASWRDLYVAANALRRDAAEVFAAEGEALALGNLAAATDDAAIPDNAFAFPLPPFGAPRAKPFVPNGNLLARLDAWAACPPDAKKRDPFVLYGPTGSGRKTSLAECFARNSALFLGRVHHWRLDRDLLEDRTPGALAAAWDDLGADLEAYRPTCVVAELATLDDDATPAKTLIADFAALCHAHKFRGVLLCDDEPAWADVWWKDDPNVAAGISARVAPAWPWWGRPADFGYDDKATDRYVRTLLAGAASPHWLAACVPLLRDRPAARILAIRDRLRAGEPLTAEDFVGEDKPVDVTALNVEDLLIGYLAGDYSHRDLWAWLVALFHDDDCDDNGEAIDPLHVRLGRPVFHPLLGRSTHPAFYLVIDFLIPFALWGRLYDALFRAEELDGEDFGAFATFPSRLRDPIAQEDAMLALTPWAYMAALGEVQNTFAFRMEANQIAKRWDGTSQTLKRLWAVIALELADDAYPSADLAFAEAAKQKPCAAKVLLLATRLICLACWREDAAPQIERTLRLWEVMLGGRFPQSDQLFLPRLRRMFRQGQFALVAAKETEAICSGNGATNP